MRTCGTCATYSQTPNNGEVVYIQPYEALLNFRGFGHNLYGSIQRNIIFLKAWPMACPPLFAVFLMCNSHWSKIGYTSCLHSILFCVDSPNMLKCCCMPHSENTSKRFCAFKYGAFAGLKIEGVSNSRPYFCLGILCFFFFFQVSTRYHSTIKILTKLAANINESQACGHEIHFLTRRCYCTLLYWRGKKIPSWVFSFGPSISCCIGVSKKSNFRQ